MQAPYLFAAMNLFRKMRRMQVERSFAGRTRNAGTFSAGLVAVLAVALAACGSVPEGEPDAAVDGNDNSGTPRSAVAPSAGKPMYQGTQRTFKTTSGGTCRGRVAASMGSTAFCYLSADDNVKCAGLLAGTDYGLTFKPLSIGGVEQILVMFRNDGLCVTKADHTALCLGTNLTALGTAATSFTRWTARTDLVALATGSWDQLCGITMTGQVYCGGGLAPNDYGNPPVAVGAAGQSGLWVDPAGAAKLSDPAVLRPAEGRTDCQITAAGLRCGGAVYGPSNGTLVSGTVIDVAGAPSACWLTDNGNVTCIDGPRFAAGKVVYLAASTTTDSLCALYNDGAIWCIGSNANGKLGTNSTTALAVETMVQPPGSARVKCE